VIYLLRHTYVQRGKLSTNWAILSWDNLRGVRGDSLYLAQSTLIMKNSDIVSNGFCQVNVMSTNYYLLTE